MNGIRELSDFFILEEHLTGNFPFRYAAAKFLQNLHFFVNFS